MLTFSHKQSQAHLVALVPWLAGILYSVELPFMRWKRSPVLAAGCILVVRALAVQLGFFYHMQVCARYRKHCSGIYVVIAKGGPLLYM